jgi:diadenylate cyclase
MQLPDIFGDLSAIKVITGILDLIIVWYVLYLIITVVKGTKAIQLLKETSFLFKLTI